jgi:hypothetical protein
LKKLRIYLSILLIICLSWKAEAQTLTYQFIDPCTSQVTNFSVPATGTVVVFYGQSRQFTSADVASGAFAAWINQVYADYRKISPCGQQQGQVTQNQITSQIIGNTVQSVVSSIMSQAQSAASSTITGVATSASTANASSAGGNDAASKNNKNEENSKSSSNSFNGTTGNGSGSGNNSSTGGSNSSGTSEQTKQTDTKTEEKGEEVAATTTMNVDQQNQNSSKDDNGGGGGGKGGKNGGKSGTTNPLIVSSDFTTAQNLDKTFTPILNLSMNQSSMTGMSSWGLTSMIWFNFKQFALSGKYTKINFSKNGKLKWVHNINLTGVYSYGNVIGFVGYSGILNAGKWGVTGFNTSAAMTLITGEQKNTFISPSITAFYTKPFKSSKRLTISPELYIISTPLIYSTVDKVTTTDRTFSAFIGSGFDYQLTRRFKLNMNYKANLSTNPDFPILSFFLIGSKINL